MATTERMNPLDVWFLHLEDAADQLHIGSVGVFAGPAPSYAEVLDIIERRLADVPRYRQRVRRVPFDLARPVWEDARDFSLQHHVRHTALPGPGGPEQLQALVGRVMSQPLDHRLPLWEHWFVEGLADGRWALLSKVHHCLVDGVGGTDLLATVLSTSPDDGPGTWRPWHASSPLPATGLVRDAAADRAVELGHLARGVRRLARRPSAALERGVRHAVGAADVLRAVRPGSSTSLTGPISPHRRWTTVTVDLADVGRVRAVLGGTHNDVVLALIARGFRDLLRERHELADVDVVRALVPVSIRGEDERGQLQNRVAAILADLPVGEHDAVARLDAVCTELRRRKRSGADAATSLLVAGSSLAPPWTLRLAMGGITRVLQRTGQPFVHTVATNVPGPPVPLYLLGRRLEEVHPYVPIAEAIRTGIAVYTYDGSVVFGLTGDEPTTEDLGVLAAGIEDGMLELLRAAELHSPTGRVG